jgi:short-subunit dehydrogenase
VALCVYVRVACRDPQKTEPVVKELQTTTKNADVEFIPLDLSNLASIRSFVEEIKKRGLVIDILINNAGVMVCCNCYRTSLRLFLYHLL